MPRVPRLPKKTHRVLSVILSVVLAAPIALVLGWLIDDVALGHDVPRGVTVAGVDIGGLDRAAATSLLDNSPFGDQSIELTWAGSSLVSSATNLGVSIDSEATLELAEDRGRTRSQPIRWARAFFNTRTIEPVLAVDNSMLEDLFTTGEGSAFGIEFGLPDVELAGGEFVATSHASVPQVDIEELDRLLIGVALAPLDDRQPVEVPTLGDQLIDNADTELAERANALSAGGINLSLVGFANSYHVPQPTLRSWMVFSGTRQQPEISLDPEAVLGVLRSLFVGFGDTGEEPAFIVDPVAGVRIIGGAPGSVCCENGTTNKILAAMEAGDNSVELLLHEDPDAKGTAWALSLGINELVGEFTTNFKPGQTRVVNIDRIAELTQGALILPGETFSINEFVGRRTRENGFVSAGVIANGVFASSVGGGISQYATTLFNAAFFAGLDFGAYQSHSIYISRYPYGREATMSFPHPDLQIINNTPYGVLLWPTTTATSITVSLYSTKWVFGEQTGQTKRSEGASCTRVTTERTRTWIDDGRTEIDTVTARYRPEGISCSGGSSVPTTSTIAPPETTTTTVPTTTTIPASTTTVPTTTTIPASTTTTAAPTTTTVPPTTTTTAPP